MNQVVTDPVKSPTWVLIYLGLAVKVVEVCFVDARHSAAILLLEREESDSASKYRRCNISAAMIARMVALLPHSCVFGV